MFPDIKKVSPFDMVDDVLKAQTSLIAQPPLLFRVPIKKHNLHNGQCVHYGNQIKEMGQLGRPRPKRQ